MNYRKIRTKVNVGPEFPKCECCRLVRRLGKALTMNNRVIRHKAKQRLREAVRR